MKTIILTGNIGDIGKSIQNELISSGYSVIGIDKGESVSSSQIQFDLSLLNSDKSRKQLEKEIADKTKGKEIFALVNNAAIQKLDSLDQLSLEDFEDSFITNTLAPLFLTKILKTSLENSNGHIINIGSVHSKLTKKGFISYATSKSALLGLTQSLAIELSPSIKVNMISPAAVDTKMLKESFKNNKDAIQELKNFHPSNEIGKPSDISKLVLSILLNDIHFLTGSNIDLTGGIHSKLHDPNP